MAAERTEGTELKPAAGAPALALALPARFALCVAARASTAVGLGNRGRLKGQVYGTSPREIPRSRPVVLQLPIALLP